MTYRLPMQLCPKCGYAMDAHSPTKDGDPRPPHEGDIGVCVECLTTLVFDKNLRLREATPADEAGVPEDIIMKLRALKTMKMVMGMELGIKPEKGTRQ